MIRNPILPRFESLSHLWRPEPHNLRSAFLRPDKLPFFVQDCPSAMRILDLLGPIPWINFQNGISSAFGTNRNSSRGFQRRVHDQAP